MGRSVAQILMGWARGGGGGWGIRPNLNWERGVWTIEVKFIYRNKEQGQEDVTREVGKWPARPLSLRPRACLSIS